MGGLENLPFWHRDPASLEFIYEGVLTCAEPASQSVIAARWIEHLEIGRMSVWESGADESTIPDATIAGKVTISHALVPWVEANRIDHLAIGDFREGVVWSGELEAFDGPAWISTDTSNDYASVGTVAIGCTGDAAALWIQDATMITVAGDLRGQINMPQLPSASLLSIGGGLVGTGSTGADSCGCAAPDACTLTPGATLVPLPNNPSPLRSPREIGRMANASIVLADPRGLKGRVVINAANVEGGEWAEGAEIIVGSVSLSPKPDYAGSSLAYGGGVVGVVPFIHYQDDAFPMFLPAAPTYPASGHGPVPPTLRAQDSRVDGAGRLRFTGQLAPATPAQVAAAAKVQKNVGGAWVLDTGWEITLADMPFSTVRNELRFRWTAGTASAPAGEYRVVYGEIPPATQGGTPTPLGLLTCAGLAPGAPPAAVPAFVWPFDVSAGAYTECYSTTLDYNTDASVNSDDLGDFITDFFTVPPIAGPGGYAVYCVENAAPYDLGYKAGYTLETSAGQCNPPFPDNLGDYITAYYNGC